MGGIVIIWNVALKLVTVNDPFVSVPVPLKMGGVVQTSLNHPGSPASGKPGHDIDQNPIHRVAKPAIKPMTKKVATHDQVG
jgi:hypothetical protein